MLNFLTGCNTKTTYKIVQYFVSFWLFHRRKYSTVATATTAFFSLIKPNPEASGQNILDYFINQFGINKKNHHFILLQANTQI